MLEGRDVSKSVYVDNRQQHDLNKIFRAIATVAVKRPWLTRASTDSLADSHGNVSVSARWSRGTRVVRS